MTKRFTAETVVAEAIAADPAVIDRLAALHPAFQKLRNPLLRKVMARLVTLADAARVAGVAPDTVIAAANGTAPVSPAPAAPQPSEGEPLWVAHADLQERVALDVRPILAQGGEPLGPIMRAASEVPVRGLLVLDAPFDPAPLRRVLGNKGFEVYGRQLAPDHWRLWFRRGEAPTGTAPAPGAAKEWRAADGLHIDVRGLEPPQPMLAILRLLESGAAEDGLTVHHEREPIFLYPELAERGWQHRLVAGEPGEIRLAIARR
jgi:Uncharacterized conserved protein (DUF2249)/Domain of unknown function (DUF1858)